jgi:hypothetical protein
MLRTLRVSTDEGTYTSGAMGSSVVNRLLLLLRLAMIERPC